MTVAVSIRGPHLTIIEGGHARTISALSVVGAQLVPTDMSAENAQVQAAAAAAWTPEVVEAYRAQLAAAVAPEPLSLDGARQQLIAMLDRATRPILDAYPDAERLSWAAKEAEAAAVLAAAEPAPALAPLLAGELAAQFAQTPTAPQLTERASTVLAKAAAWRTLISAVSGLRQRFETELEAAPDDDARRAVLTAAGAAISGLEQS